MVDSLAVYYSGTLDIPYAVGSVSVPIEGNPRSPLSGSSSLVTGYGAEPLKTAVPSFRRKTASPGASIASVGRYTHRRYCYLRDGGTVESDEFHRWLMYERQRCLTLQQSSHDEPSTLREMEAETCSPSLLYAMLSCVVFLLPKSFPQPRRVLRRPPFVIEDSTWAEHLVEVQLHFHAHLKIPPVIVIHQVQLDTRIVVSSGKLLIPQLLARNAGKPKEPPATEKGTTTGGMVKQEEKEVVPSSSLVPTAPESENVVVAEKVDTLRMVHPTTEVVAFFSKVLELAASPVVHSLRAVFKTVRAEGLVAPESATAGDVLHSATNSFPFPWSLPFEGAIARYVGRRSRTSVTILQAVLANLKREREELEESSMRAMKSIVRESEEVQQGIVELHEGCCQLSHKR